MNEIRALFVDIGGVLLTNGWDRASRALAAKTFGYDFDEMENIHRLTFSTYELGKITLDQYLDRVLFYKKRPFKKIDYKTFMIEESRPFPEMIEFCKELKERYELKVAVVSNEGKELTEYRIEKFELGSFVDFFVSSCFVHLCKPDYEIYTQALSLAQVKGEEVVYLDDRLLFVDIAKELKMHGVHHTSFKTTKKQIEKMFS